LAGQPAGNQTDQQDDQKTFILDVHGVASRTSVTPLVPQHST
jgi:hypothetical protein